MLSHLIERRETIIGDASAYSRLMAKLRNVKAGVAVNDHTALNHSAVWACTDFISSTLAMLPINLYRRDGDDNAEKQDTPVSRIVTRRPNPRQVPFTWKSIQQAQAILYGGGYAWIERARGGEPSAIWPLPPKETRPFERDGTLLYYTRVADRPLTLMADDVLHLPGFSLGGLTGLPFLQYAAEVIGHGLAAQQFSAGFFGEGLTPRFVVTHPGDVGVEGRARMSEDLEETYGGKKSANKSLVLDEGMKVQVLTIAPEQAQMLETRRDNRLEIAGMMRVPPQFIGLWDRATYSNSEQMDLMVVKYTLGAWQKRWEEELAVKLLTEEQQESGWFWKINTNALVRGDIKTRSEYYRTMVQGILSVNEIREKEDFPSIPGFDEPFVPLNMTAGDSEPPDDDTETEQTGTQEEDDDED